VRLRGCVAIELFVGAVIASSLAAGAIWGVSELRGAAAGETASAAELEGPGRAPARAKLSEAGAAGAPVEASAAGPASGQGEVAPAEAAAREPPPWSGEFLGVSDEELLAPLRDSPVKAVKVNKGGSSLSLRVDFESGGRAACKPNQVHLQSQPRREIAAYRVNRLLGLGSVPPAVGRRFQVLELADRFKPDARQDRVRYMAEIVPEKGSVGTVLSQLTWWVPQLEAARIDGFEIESTEGVVTWKRYLTIGVDIPPGSLTMTSQISNLLLFDFVINNSDRWSGGNIKSSLDQTVLVFLDNTLAFGNDPNGHSRVRTYLRRSQRFSRKLVEHLRGLDEAALDRAVTTDIEPFALLLEKAEIHAIIQRREVALRYIDELIAKHGEDAVLAFP
jgi:hypothetical protein